VTPRLHWSGQQVSGFGDKLQAAERLLRLGARATVVCDALDAQGALRALTRRLYRELRGSARPRGPLPIDMRELLSNATTRLNASVFLEHWSSLRRAGVPRPDALACAWDQLASICERERAPGRMLSIDHAWVLACALERGELERVVCCQCRRGFFDAPARPTSIAARARTESAGGRAVATVQGRCPHCSPGTTVASCSGTLPTLDQQQAAARTLAMRDMRQRLRSAASHPLSGLAQRHVWAEALFRAGGRPPMVSSLTGLSINDRLRQLFLEVVGRGSPQGALPQLGTHVLATYAAKLQASVLAVTAERLRKAGCAPPDILLATWTLYRDMFGTAARFDINSAALLVRAGRHPDFTLVRCRHCDSSYLELKLDLRASHCPVCRTLKQARREAACEVACDGT